MGEESQVLFLYVIGLVARVGIPPVYYFNQKTLKSVHHA